MCENGPKAKGFPRVTILFRALLCLCLVGTVCAAEQAVDLMSDTWEAVDALGRAAVTAPEAPAPRADRFVGMFCFLWLGAHGQSGPHDIGKILAAHPEAVTDANHPEWGPMHAFHHWGEPLFGYHLSDDPWVIGKHAQMLADAQVDVILFDVTNQETYRKNYLALCAVYAALRAPGSAPRRSLFSRRSGTPGRWWTRSTPTSTGRGCTATSGSCGTASR